MIFKNEFLPFMKNPLKDNSLKSHLSFLLLWRLQLIEAPSIICNRAKFCLAIYETFLKLKLSIYCYRSDPEVRCAENVFLVLRIVTSCCWKLLVTLIKGQALSKQPNTYNLITNKFYLAQQFTWSSNLASPSKLIRASSRVSNLAVWLLSIP